MTQPIKLFTVKGQEIVGVWSTIEALELMEGVSIQQGKLESFSTGYLEYADETLTTQVIQDEDGVESYAWRDEDNNTWHIKALFVGETFETAKPYYEWAQLNGLKPLERKNNEESGSISTD